SSAYRGVSALCRARRGGGAVETQMLIDSHCHLDFPDFANELDAVVARARAAAIDGMVTISTRIRRQAALLAIARRFPDVYCSIGTHPHYVHEEAYIMLSELVFSSLAENSVTIGEVGLYSHNDNAHHGHHAH